LEAKENGTGYHRQGEGVANENLARGPYLPTVEFIRFLCVGFAMNVLKQAYDSNSFCDIMLWYMRNIGLHIAKMGARPYLVVVFTMFVNKFSSYLSPI
jgi:hypothetical protein